jgi:hypothetical protein
MVVFEYQSIGHDADTEISIDAFLSGGPGLRDDR